MILSQSEIRAEVEKGNIKFDPPLEEKQWGGSLCRFEAWVKIHEVEAC